MYHDYEIRRHQSNKALAQWFFLGGLILSIIFYVATKIATIKVLLAITFVLTGCLSLSLLVTTIAFIAWITEYTWLRILKDDVSS